MGKALVFAADSLIFYSLHKTRLAGMLPGASFPGSLLASAVNCRGGAAPGICGWRGNDGRCGGSIQKA